MTPSWGLTVLRNPALSPELKTLCLQWAQREKKINVGTSPTALRRLIPRFWQAQWGEGSESPVRGMCLSQDAGFPRNPALRPRLTELRGEGGGRRAAWPSGTW